MTGSVRFFIALMIAGLVVIATTLVANASPCGGGDSDSDSDSSSSSDSDSSDYGSSDDDSSSSSTPTPACLNTTDIVGRSECRRFGSGWNRARTPRLQLGVGISFHSLPMRDRSFAGTAAHAENIGYHVGGNEMQESALVGGGWDLRVTGAISRNFYAGAEFGMAGLVVDGRHHLERGALSVDVKSGFLLQGGPVLGARAPIAGGFEVLGEVLVGGRAVLLSAETQHLDCLDESAATRWEFLVQPRVGLHRWLGPAWSVSALVGSNPLRRGDVSMGVMFQGHLRAYDGSR